MSQTGHLGLANASALSGEQLRRTLAEVERLLWEMRARDLGAPRAAAEAELAAAQRCEWCWPWQAGGERQGPGSSKGEVSVEWHQVGITGQMGLVVTKWRPGVTKEPGFQSDHPHPGLG